VSGGDPEETLRVEKTLGFVDGQTTNPSLIAKNPEVQQRIASGRKLDPEEENVRMRASAQ
jgi:transaldolase